MKFFILHILVYGKPDSTIKKLHAKQVVFYIKHLNKVRYLKNLYIRK